MRSEAETVAALQAEGLAMLEELEVRLMATKMRPKAQRLDAVCAVGALVDAAAGVFGRLGIGERNG